MKPSPVKMQYPRQSLDDLGVDFLSRVGVQSIRRAIPFISTTDPDYRTFINELDAQMHRYSDNNITVMLMFGEGRTASSVPLGTAALISMSRAASCTPSKTSHGCPLWTMISRNTSKIYAHAMAGPMAP